jgi:hypothetical protein
MQSPFSPDKHPRNPPKAARASLVLRLDRAAGYLNPFLILLVIGLTLLDLTLYLGLAASGQPFVRLAPHQVEAPVDAAPQPPPTGPSRQ